ncbi:hypothetical protein Y032_0424g1218 [Ancylostoma ceylanicum]|uniref:Uncharacterized protein n=1 Tax=Ancylostoma ceylanicum TaxID=53326 RepID=A0A016X148_9BILA|nr:hypothetical protein Y032_0424g1218 [Ancylostoma ceylanicum]
MLWPKKVSSWSRHVAVERTDSLQITQLFPGQWVAPVNRKKVSLWALMWVSTLLLWVISIMHPGNDLPNPPLEIDDVTI